MDAFKEIVDIEKKAHKTLSSYEKRVLSNYEKRKNQLRDNAQKQKEEIKQDFENYKQQQIENYKQQAQNIIDEASKKAETIENKNVDQETKKIVEGVVNYV